MVFKATVVASLLYGCEVRWFSTAQIHQYQVFLNRCVRGLVMGPDRTIRGMRGKETQTDLRLELDMDLVATTIAARTVGYVGHVARMPPNRWEVWLLSGWLEPESGGPGRVGGAATEQWGRQVRRWMQEIEDLDGRGLGWWDLAREDHGARWKELILQWVEKRRQEDNKDTHAYRDSIRAETSKPSLLAGWGYPYGSGPGLGTVKGPRWEASRSRRNLAGGRRNREGDVPGLRTVDGAGELASTFQVPLSREERGMEEAWSEEER